ncbi:hypothetical protein [Sphingomonas fennica]|uniref:hypothetical protein n=1 Tax=Edaphosphingomonas fennica TaxID=114404 RepID=UPI001FE29F3E|nr:hypothetical protein [Sphingomonas fennica]
MNIADQLPRIFQANVDRLYRQVIVVTLDQLPVQDALAVGQTSGMDEFLDRCAAQVDNHTANEAAKAFALTLDGLFERQLCRWAHAHGAKAGSMETALPACVRIGGLDLVAAGMADDIKELHLVANVVRHGEGRSCKELQGIAPLLWDSPSLDYYDLAPAPTPASDMLRIRAGDILRYARVIGRFWGHVDPLPMAVLDPPY